MDYHFEWPIYPVYEDYVKLRSRSVACPQEPWGPVRPSIRV